MKINQENDFGQLLSDARNGSEQALGELLDRYRGYLWTIASEEIGPKLTAKVAASDVVQETYVATHRVFDRFRGTSEAELKSWLRRVLLNQVTDAARMYVGSNKRDISREIGISRSSSETGRSLLSRVHGSDPTPSALAIRTEQTAAVQKALSDLPSEQCEIVVRRSIQQDPLNRLEDRWGVRPTRCGWFGGARSTNLSSR